MPRVIVDGLDATAAAAHLPSHLVTTVLFVALICIVLNTTPVWPDTPVDDRDEAVPKRSLGALIPLVVTFVECAVTVVALIMLVPGR